MTSAADLLTVLHQIDTLRGKVCATCKHWQRRGHDSNGDQIGHCLKGYAPYGLDDGCDDWKPQNPVTPVASSHVVK